MSNIPETSYIPITQPNPEWRWWKPWQPRTILTEQGKRWLSEPNELLEAIPFRRVDEPSEGAIAFGHICFYIAGLEGHIDLTCDELPTDFADAADTAKKAFSLTLDEIAKQMKG